MAFVPYAVVSGRYAGRLIEERFAPTKHSISAVKRLVAAELRVRAEALGMDFDLSQITWVVREVGE